MNFNKEVQLLNKYKFTKFNDGRCKISCRKFKSLCEHLDVMALSIPVENNHGWRFVKRDLFFRDYQYGLKVCRLWDWIEQNKSDKKQTIKYIENNFVKKISWWKIIWHKVIKYFRR